MFEFDRIVIGNRVIVFNMEVVNLVMRVGMFLLGYNVVGVVVVMVVV